MVHIGAVDAPVTIDEIDAAMAECVQVKQTELHVLGWEWEMGLYDLMVPRQKRGVKLLLLQIPREVMEQQAVDKGDIHSSSWPIWRWISRHPRKLTAVVTLKDFVIPNTELIPEEVRTKVKKWSDYIDYWAVDWDFQDDTFMQGWVTYRTRKDRTLALTSDPHTYEKPGKYRVFVKVVDISERYLAGLRSGGEVAMAKSSLPTTDLPEIPGAARGRSQPPFSSRTQSTERLAEDTSGRRPSRLLLIQKLRAAVDHWRDEGYPGASDVTRRLFEYWFEEDHEVAGFLSPSAITSASAKLSRPWFMWWRSPATETPKALVEHTLRCSRRTCSPSPSSFRPPWTGDARFAVTSLNSTLRECRICRRKNYGATPSRWPQARARPGSWRWQSSGHTSTRKRVSGSDLSTNFLIVAPNVIVYQRLEKDFASNRIFHELPLIPPEWRGPGAKK